MVVITFLTIVFLLLKVIRSTSKFIDNKEYLVYIDIYNNHLKMLHPFRIVKNALSFLLLALFMYLSFRFAIIGDEFNVLGTWKFYKLTFPHLGKIIGMIVFVQLLFWTLEKLETKLSTTRA